MRISDHVAGPLEASVFVEALRAKPAWFLALALFVHAVLWAIAMQVSEAAPDPELAVGLALGREWQLGYFGAPPLSAWLSEAIYWLTGSLFALRAAAALCVALAGWIIFLFARRIVGDRHGAIAVLLMVGVYPVAFPAGSLNADTVQMPLAAAAILFWWLAAGERRANAWIALGVVLGVMLYAGPQLFALIAVFAAIVAFAPRARRSFNRFDVLLSFVFGVFVFTFLITARMVWLARNGFASIVAGPGSGIEPRALLSPLELPLSILLGQGGLFILVFLATAYAVRAAENAPVFLRETETPFARRSAIALTFAPAAIAILALIAFALPAKAMSLAPLVMLTGLFAVLMTGERLLIRRQRLVGIVAAIFLLLSPAMQVVSSFASPWFGERSRATNWPAPVAARIFTDIYRTRTGQPLEFVIGERIRAAQIAISSRDRPRIIADGDLAKAPWIDAARFKGKGGIVFWEISGANSDAPAELVSRLPAFVAEAPLRLPWLRGGGLDPVRLGWAIVPPQQ